MTRAEALAEARKRWKNGHATKKSEDGYAGPYRVGLWAKGYAMVVMGSGDSWEAAFADADRRAK